MKGHADEPLVTISVPQQQYVAGAVPLLPALTVQHHLEGDIIIVGQ
jgi:hypothetical protein